MDIMLRQNKRFPLFITSSFCLATMTLWGQQINPPSNAEQSGAIFHADTRVVDLHATVVDKSGHLVTTLPREAFTVFENGVQQQITNFKREDVPVSMGLVVDNSGSMRDKRSKVEAAALTLVKDSNPQDEV